MTETDIMDKIRPVFIGACQRSGTTMLGSMLGASPDAFTTPESQFKNILFEKKYISIKLLRDHVLKDFRLKLWQIDLNEILKNVKEGQSGKYVLNTILQQYQRQNNLLQKRVWVDHTPSNIFHINNLAQIYPDAKFLFLIRDGRAVMNSYFNVSWGCNTAYEAADKWLSTNSFGLAAKLNYSERVKIAYYEKIVLDPQKELKEICCFLGISYSDRMINGNKKFLPKYTKSQHDKVGRKPDPAYINKWKYILKPKDIYIFELKAGGLLETLGYGLTRKKVNLIKGDGLYAEVYSLLKRYLFDRWVRKVKMFIN